MMCKFLTALLLVGAATAQQWGGGYRRPVVPAPLANDGRVVDTPEIANLKSAHFAAHDAAIRALPRQPLFNAAPYQQQQQQDYDDGSYRAERYEDGGQQGGRYTQQQQDNNLRGYDDYEAQQQPRWKGPFAKIEFTSDGKFIKETPEVAHARQQHLAALEHARKTNPSTGYEGEVYGGQEQQYRAQEQGGRGAYNDGRGGGYGNDDRRGGYEDDGQYRGEGAIPYRNLQQQGPALFQAANQFAAGGRQQGYY